MGDNRQQRSRVAKVSRLRRVYHAGMFATATTIASPARRTREHTIGARLIAALAVIGPVLALWLVRARRAALYVGGFGAISYGAWIIHPAAGLIVGGVLALVLDMLMTEPATEATS